MKRTVFLVFIFGCFLGSAFSQDWKADLERASAIFLSADLDIEIEHLFYPSPTAAAATERETVRFSKQGDKYRLAQYGTELVCDGNYVVLVNDHAGVVGINKTETGQPNSQVKHSEGFDALLNSIGNLAKTMGLDTLPDRESYTCTYLGEHQGVKSYRFDYPYGEYRQTTVYLSSKTGLLERISCIFRRAEETEPGELNQPRIDFVYKKQVTSVDFPDSLFSFSDIVTVASDGSVTLMEKYGTYILMNNLTK